MINDTEFDRTPSSAGPADLTGLTEVHVEVAVELGRATVSLGTALEFGPGAVITLDRDADRPVDLRVNGKLVARGQVVVVDNLFGLRITEVIADEAPIVGAALSGLTGASQLAA